MTGVAGVIALLVGICLWMGVTLVLWRREVRRDQRQDRPGRVPPPDATVADEAEEWLSRH